MYSIKDILRKIKWFIQRGRRGYADCDLWSFDLYLANMLTKALKQFIDGCHTHPMDLENARWKKILEDMLAGFKATVAIGELQTTEQYEKEYHKLKKTQDRGLALFVKYFNHLWD